MVIHCKLEFHKKGLRKPPTVDFVHYMSCFTRFKRFDGTLNWEKYHKKVFNYSSDFSATDLNSDERDCVIISFFPFL